MFPTQTLVNRSNVRKRHAMLKVIVMCVAWSGYLLIPSLLWANPSDPSTTPFDKALRQGPSTRLRTGSGQAQDRLRAGFAEIVEGAKHGTVGILNQSASADGNTLSVRGSGIYLGDGYILTARHATKRQGAGTTADPPHVSVIASTLEEAPASLVGVNQFLDVALYRISQEKVPRGLAARTFSQTEALPGERVFTVGYPLGWGPAISYGHVGNPDTFLRTVQSRLLQVDLSACSGNSGGGLFNAQGEIVGLIHAIIQTETGEERRCSRFAFAVPGPLVHKIVTALRQGKPFHFSKLGLQLTSVKMKNQWHMAVAQATGPARRAGFKKGDVLLSIDNQPIDSASQLKTYVIEQTRPLQPVSIRILRNHKEKVIRVILGKAPSS